MVPSNAFAQGKETRAARRAEAEKAKGKDIDEQVRYKDLPAGVKATFDKERKDHTPLSYWHVIRDGKEFYRAIVDTKGTDTVIRAKPEGELLTVEDARDIPDKEITQKAKGAKRQVRLAKDETDGDEVDFNRLPGEVKTEIGRLAKSGKVDEVIEYKRGGKTYYQAEVDDKGGKSYFYTVDESGKEVENLPRFD
jgi:hypothetical protein